MSSARQARSPQDTGRALRAGLLSFPTTHFRDDLSFDEEPYRAHVRFQMDSRPAAIFAAGGTGEYFSLDLAEFETVVAAAVAETAARVPVLAGCGYGTRLALEFVRAAERAGADGILLLPPYLVNAEQAGLEAHVRAVCQATPLAVVLYNRDNAILDAPTLARLCEACPNLVGFKDGVGDLELLVRIRSALGDRVSFIGGLPTAETIAAPYREAGVLTYSSAILNFAPRFALDFFDAVCARDHAFVAEGLQTFVLPYIAIRNRRKGYAVSIVKAAMRLAGRGAGAVRAPLVDLDEEELARLSALLDLLPAIRRRPATSAAAGA